MKRPNRTTVDVALQIAPTSLSKLKNDALERGFRTQRAYLEALIERGLPAEEYGQPERWESMLPTQLPAILGHRTVLALEAITERIDAGEALEPIAAELQAIRREVIAALNKSRSAYEREVDAREAIREALQA